jgi:hypothetical protein
MPDVYVRHQGRPSRRPQALTAQEGQAKGSVYGRWLGLDLLAGPGLFGRAWPRLYAGYVTDAIDREVKPWQRRDAGAVCPDGVMARPSPVAG